MIVVADAGPLIHLSAIGRLDLILAVSAEVLIPPAVFHEVVVVGAGLPGSKEVEAAPWIQVVEPGGTDMTRALLGVGLHRGESEAIALAVERRASWLLIDERQGRLAAEGMGLRVLGSIGVLVAAKARGEVAAVAPLLEALRASGLWMTDTLVAQVLASLGESPGP